MLVPLTLVLYVALTVETVLIAGGRWGTMPITVGAIALYGVGAIIVLISIAVRQRGSYSR